MTKNEFIQEAALRIVCFRRDLLMSEVYDAAVNLANCVFRLESESVVTPQNALSPISEICKELDRIDIEEKKKEKARAMDNGDRYWRGQKSGYAIKMQGVCRREGISTLQDLLAVGSVNFGKLFNVGYKLQEHVSIALKNLYDIDAW